MSFYRFLPILFILVAYLLFFAGFGIGVSGLSFAAVCFYSCVFVAPCWRHLLPGRQLQTKMRKESLYHPFRCRCVGVAAAVMASSGASQLVPTSFLKLCLYYLAKGNKDADKTMLSARRHSRAFGHDSKVSSSDPIGSSFHIGYEGKKACRTALRLPAAERPRRWDYGVLLASCSGPNSFFSRLVGLDSMLYIVPLKKATPSRATNGIPEDRERQPACVLMWPETDLASSGCVFRVAAGNMRALVIARDFWVPAEGRVTGPNAPNSRSPARPAHRPRCSRSPARTQRTRETVLSSRSLTAANNASPGENTQLQVAAWASSHESPRSPGRETRGYSLTELRLFRGRI